MSVQLHPDIETLDKESLCYSIYAQLYHNFFNAQQKKDDEHPYGIEEGDETSLRLKNTAYGFASAIAGAVAGEGGSGSGGLLLDYLKHLKHQRLNKFERMVKLGLMSLYYLYHNNDH